MKEWNTLMYVQISIIIAILTLMGTYIIVDMKTKNISKQVVHEMLILEYNKVGGKSNYDKITKIQREQIVKSLESYEGGGNDNQPEIDNYPSPTGGTIDLDIANKVTTDGTYILGNPDAEISFVEYSDLECPFCQRLHQSGTIEKILEEYDGNVNFIFKQFPLSFHAQAPMEADAALCVGEIAGTAKYYEFIEAVFDGSKANGNSYTTESIGELGATIGIDKEKLLSCIESGKMTQKSQDQMSEGGRIFGITGTPGNVLINNKTGKWDKLPGAYPFEAFKEKIDTLLQ